MNENNNRNPIPKAAKIVFATTIASILCIAIGTKSQSTIIIGIGVLLIVATFVIATIFTEKKPGGVKSTAKLDINQYGKYLPILADQRTKQHPEVQRLLQYTEVQRVFFDASSLASPATANDENVRELLALFDEMLAQAAIDGTVYGAQSGIAPAAVDPMQVIKQEQQKKNNTPRSKIGTLLYFAGLAMFLLPFFTVFFMAMSSGTSTPALKTMSFILTGCAPIGMILIVIGRLFKK